MPSSSTDTLSPSIVSALWRFRRVVFVAMALAAVIALIYTALSGSGYSAKAAVVISQPPSNLSPFFGAGAHQSPAGYLAAQVTILTSQEVSNDAAKIVNQRISSANVTGSEIHGGLTVKPQSGAAGVGANTSTQVIVVLGSAESATASADAVVKAYLNHVEAQIRTQASQSVAALDKQIAQTTSALNGLPPPTSTTPTVSPTVTPLTTPPVPRTTTTRPPHTTTTRAPRTTTTRQPPTTTSTTTTTTVPPTALGDHTNIGLTSFASGAPVRLAAVVVAPSTTTTTAPGTTAPATSTPATTSQYAQRAALTATLISLSRSKAQLLADEDADLRYEPTVTPAAVPSSPANDHYLRNFILGGLVGAIIGIIVAYALAFYRRQFERPDEPELVYRVPLLAVVPAYQYPAWMLAGLPVLTDPSEEPAEAFRIMATILRSMRGEEESLLFAFSAAAPRSGTTSTVANVGLALAEMGERVLVVDGDPIGRGLTRALTDTNQERPLTAARKGFSEVIGGYPLMEAIIPADFSSRLLVLTAGLDPNLAVHRWKPHTMRLALNDALAHFDFVLVDVPPVGVSSYAVDLVVACENLGLVIPYLDALDHHNGLAERLEVAGTRLSGYVFNGIPSNGRFSAYYPILRGHDAVISQPVPVPVGHGVEAGSDITGVVPAVITHDATITQAVPIVGTPDGPITTETPIVEPPDAEPG